MPAIGGSSSEPRKASKSFSPRGSCGRRWRSGRRPRRPPPSSVSITISPTCLEGMSFSPDASSWRTSPVTIRSMRSSGTGRLRSAMRTERASLSRSNATRRPSDLTTVSSRSCTRSTVVKRWPQPMQNRRRRMAAASSAGRLSFTWVSVWPQNGHLITNPCALNRSETVRTSRAPRAATERSTASFRPSFDRANPSNTSLIISPTWRNSAAPKPRVVAAGLPRRMPLVIAGLAGSKRDGVLVGGDQGAFQACLGRLAGGVLRTQIHQHQVAIGPAGHDVAAQPKERLPQHARVVQHRLLVGAELRAQRPRRTRRPWRRSRASAGRPAGRGTRRN